MLIEDVARLCHQANKAYCESIGDDSQGDWMNAPEWQKQSARLGVKFILDNPSAPASASHNSWLEEKTKEGWKYGIVKDVENKTHPCYVPYSQLPEEQKVKDYLFKGIVVALRNFVTDFPIGV